MIYCILFNEHVFVGLLQDEVFLTTKETIKHWEGLNRSFKVLSYCFRLKPFSCLAFSLYHFLLHPKCYYLMLLVSVGVIFNMSRGLVGRFVPFFNFFNNIFIVRFRSNIQLRSALILFIS